MRTDPDLKLIIMGDLNDDPMDLSLAVLGAKKHVEDMTEDDLYNPWWVTLEDKGVGTLLYRGKWNLFDQIILSHPCVHMVAECGWMVTAIICLPLYI